VRFVVALAIVRSGATVGSTRDVIEAPSAVEAERIAIDAWASACPGYSFEPLCTTQSLGGDVTYPGTYNRDGARLPAGVPDVGTGA
jgi:hypothetical protein